MQVRFLGQPFPGSAQIGEPIQSALGNGDSNSAWFVTAWAKQSGLGRLEPSLRAFREGGGRLEAVLGVDEGGATIEGLEMALELFDAAWIFHDPGARTFHPKMYVVESEAAATMVVGSGNLTKGGLFTNYEVALEVTLDLAIEEDASLRAEGRGYFDRLSGSSAAKPLTATLIEELMDDPTVLLGSERQANRARSGSAGAAVGSPVFGSQALSGLLGSPAPAAPPPGYDSEDNDNLVAGPMAPQAQSELGEEGFFKALSRNDVSLKGSPGQIIVPIAFLPFFGELKIQLDNSATGGVRQSHREFPLIYRDGGSEAQLNSGRVILYEPAVEHKRPNKEVRFTLRNRSIMENLSKDDVLCFTKEAGRIVVERHPAGWRPDGVAQNIRYAAL